MTQELKKTLSISAIVLASVTGGMILSSDLGLTTKSQAQQTSSSSMQTTQGAVPTVTIPSFADVAARVMPAVVSITTTEIVKESDAKRRGGVDPFDFFFPDPQQRRGQGKPPEQDDEQRQLSGGTGFIISSDGYIITNNHVVENASKVEVRYGPSDDEKTVTAKVVGRDPSTDIALIKISVAGALPTVPLGDSDRIRAGDWAIAVGNPLSFERSVTVGVISATGRSLGISEATQSFENFIQTDAAINFGNSGGPLLNINGEVIGINTAIRAYAQNLGFATPINVAKKIYPQLKAKGKVTRGYLGIRIGEVTDREQQAFGLPVAHGAIVQSVDGGPGERAGLQHGDVITQIDGQQIRKNRDLIDYVSDQPPGTKIAITYYRNGEKRTTSATTGERPASSDPAASQSDNSPQAPARNKLGISVQEITPAARQQYGLDDSLGGVVVTSVKNVSAAAEAGLTEGDVISEMNGQKVTTLDQLRRIVDATKPGSLVRVYITRGAGQRGGRAQSFYAIVQIPDAQ